MLVKGRVFERKRFTACKIVRAKIDAAALISIRPVIVSGLAVRLWSYSQPLAAIPNEDTDEHNRICHAEQLGNGPLAASLRGKR